jgi:ribose transport system substrate-binding protein
MSLRTTISAFISVAAVGLAASGCGDDSDASASDAATGGSSSSSASLAKAYKGVVGQPPIEAATPEAGAKVWVVSCGEQVPTCATPAEAAVDAAKVAGMSPTLCDGKLNPQGWADCIRQGISAQSDGIIVIGQDCASFQAALQEAKSAGIPVIGAGGNDCDVTGGENLYAATLQNLPDMTNQEWWGTIGALQADWIIGKTDGKAKVLSLKFTDAIWGGWIQDGFTKELATCSGCEVVDTLETGNADVAGGTLAQKFSTALLKNPDANAVNVPIDGWFFAGLAQAVQSSGRSNDLNVIGAFGEPGNLDFIRKNGGEDATVGFSASWDGWAGVDALIRVFADQQAQPVGYGLQVVDADNNLPKEGELFSYNPVIDYAAAYTKAWGA